MSAAHALLPTAAATIAASPRADLNIEIPRVSCVNVDDIGSSHIDLRTGRARKEASSSFSVCALFQHARESPSRKPAGNIRKGRVEWCGFVRGFCGFVTSESSAPR
jgi:hypothetical protein